MALIDKTKNLFLEIEFEKTKHVRLPTEGFRQSSGMAGSVQPRMFHY
jgi:hypothetical protein